MQEASYRKDWIKGDFLLASGGQGGWKGASAAKHQLPFISRYRRPLKQRESPVHAGTSLASQGGEGFDLPPAFKYKWDK